MARPVVRVGSRSCRPWWRYRWGRRWDGFHRLQNPKRSWRSMWMGLACSKHRWESGLGFVLPPLTPDFLILGCEIPTFIIRVLNFRCLSLTSRRQLGPGTQLVVRGFREGLGHMTLLFRQRWLESSIPKLESHSSYGG